MTLTPNDILPLADRMKSLTFQFVLDPERWNGFNLPAHLEWKHVQFKAESSDCLPKSRGIYAFVLKFHSHDSDEERNFPIHGHILYGGITGYKSGSSRTLRQRFNEYLKENGKRIKIFQMINNWKNYLYFYYSEVEDESINLLDLEKKFNDAVQPPMAQNDFSADVKLIRKAAFS